MKTTTVFTSTLSPLLLDWIREYAFRMQKTKREVLEEALKRFQAEVMRREYIESFKKAQKDPEMHGWADEGLDDYLNQLSYLQL